MRCRVPESFLPSASFQVYNTRLPSVVNSVVVSIVVVLYEAEITFLANPSLILFSNIHRSYTFANSLTEPSGKVTLIISINFEVQI